MIKRSSNSIEAPPPPAGRSSTGAHQRSVTPTTRANALAQVQSIHPDISSARLRRTFEQIMPMFDIAGMTLRAIPL